jgi:hypothetical protein
MHCKLQTLSLVREGALHEEDKIVKHRKLKWGSTPRRTGRLTVGPNIIELEVKLQNTSKLNAWGYNWTTLFLRDVNTGTWTAKLGVSQMRQ